MKPRSTWEDLYVPSMKHKNIRIGGAERPDGSVDHYTECRDCGKREGCHMSGEADIDAGLHETWARLMAQDCTRHASPQDVAQWRLEQGSDAFDKELVRRAKEILDNATRDSEDAAG